MRLLVEHGADPKLATVQGVTPLMVAAQLGYWDGESPGPFTGVPEARAVEAVELALGTRERVNAVAHFVGPRSKGMRYLLRRHFTTYDGPHDAPLDVVPPKESLGDMAGPGAPPFTVRPREGQRPRAVLVDHGARIDAATAGLDPDVCGGDLRGQHGKGLAGNGRIDPVP